MNRPCPASHIVPMEAPVHCALEFAVHHDPSSSVPSAALALTASTASPTAVSTASDAADAGTEIVHVAFYRFARVSDPHALREQLWRLTEGLLGSILVAHEGINGMLAGPPGRIAAFQRAIASPDVQAGVFADMAWKRTICPGPELPFARRKIKVKRELVPLGIADFDVTTRAADIAATDVAPERWRDLIRRDDVVLLDNRNSFEFDHGRFHGAVDPGTGRFRDFADFVEQHAEEWKAEGKKIAMYCTGGIRCEKSSPWMQDLGLEVFQLQGGILNYFAQVPDADQDWDGACFVFDARRLLDTNLNTVPAP